jgi:hypothetical protein
MRRGTFTVGILFLLVAFFVLEQGPVVLTPLANIAGLSSHYAKESVILPPTLYSIPASNYGVVSAELESGGQVTGSLEVADGREVAFYVMNEGNFSLWRAGRPSVLVLAKPIAISYNFTFSPSSTGTYYFVFDNQDSNTHVVIFSLSTVQNVTVLNPLVQNAGFELLLVGALLSFFGVRGGKRKAETGRVVESGWKCKFCGALNEAEEHAFCIKCGRSQS